MTKAIQFSNKDSNRNEAVIVADHGSTLEIRVWVNPTQRFRAYTETVEKRWVRKFIPLSGVQTKRLAEVGA